MKIFEAYYDIKLRKGLKKYLLAEGRKLSEIDRLYLQFGTYLSRIKGIGFYGKLMEASSEAEFRELLRVLFEDKWSGHMQYDDMPGYFSRYLDYLHTASALDPDLQIEGLEMPDDIWCIPGSEVTDYARPYIKDGKLAIIANPLLVKRLKPYLAILPIGMESAVAEAKGFYGNLLPLMEDSDWERLIDDLAMPKKERKAKATARNVEFQMKDGTKRVMNGNQAMEYVADLIGYDRCLSLNVLHKGEKIVTRQRDMRYESYYKPVEDGLWLNLKGSVADKVKTLRMLASFCRLPFTVSLTNNLPD